MEAVLSWYFQIFFLCSQSERFYFVAAISKERNAQHANIRNLIQNPITFLYLNFLYLPQKKSCVLIPIIKSVRFLNSTLIIIVSWRRRIIKRVHFHPLRLQNLSVLLESITFLARIFLQNPYGENTTHHRNVIVMIIIIKIQLCCKVK